MHEHRYDYVSSMASFYFLLPADKGVPMMRVSDQNDRMLHVLDLDDENRKVYVKWVAEGRYVRQGVRYSVTTDHTFRHSHLTHTHTITRPPGPYPSYTCHKWQVSPQITSHLKLHSAPCNSHMPVLDS
jgi:hypothetical protein